jgi:hypothetical protein
LGLSSCAGWIDIASNDMTVEQEVPSKYFRGRKVTEILKIEHAAPNSHDLESTNLEVGVSASQGFQPMIQPREYRPLTGARIAGKCNFAFKEFRCLTPLAHPALSLNEKGQAPLLRILCPDK